MINALWDTKQFLCGDGAVSRISVILLTAVVPALWNALFFPLITEADQGEETDVSWEEFKFSRACLSVLGSP